MARLDGRATSRYPRRSPLNRVEKLTWGVLSCLGLLFPPVAEAGLYTSSDQILILNPDNVDHFLVNSSSATLVEFYASWCGHCINFSPIYKSLARDMKEWKPAVDLAAIDCADPENRPVCLRYGIGGYPSIKFFHAYSASDSTGQPFTGFPREVKGLRQRIIDSMETHKESWPPACPPLEPTSQAEIDSFFETNTVEHLALIFENSKSYIGREVTLDLLQYENIAVRRVLSTEETLVAKMGVTEFPSCYLYHPRGNFTRLTVQKEARAFYSYALRRLPGVVRAGRPMVAAPDHLINNTKESWRTFNRSRVYMADLESALHFSLRGELAAHRTFKGEQLIALKRYVSVLAKYFPGRPMVKNLLKSVDSWLQGQSDGEVSFHDLRDKLDNTAQIPDAALPEAVTWVGCQGSKPYFRGYPCGVWTLFHVLTVQAKKGNTDNAEPLEVLQAMRGYIYNFFGCRVCAEHFENMAQEGLADVSSLSLAVLWLWSRHNRVNNRVAGALSEDPLFPKIQWPSPEMCPDCHGLKRSGEHSWNRDKLHSFLLTYYSTDNLLPDYLENESVVLAKQREKFEALRLEREARGRAERRAREALESMTQPPQPLQPNPEEEEEEEEEEAPQEEGVAGREVEAASEQGAKTPQQAAWPEAGAGRRQTRRRPSIVGMRLREAQEDIVDLDSFVNQHYKAKALRAAALASSRVKQRTLQRKEEPEPRPAVGLGLSAELLGGGGGVGMVGLQPVEPDQGPGHGQRQKRELAGQYLADAEEGRPQNNRGRWMSVLSIGFSKLDISLCVILYLLSSTCLLAMYLYFKNRLRLRRGKVSLP